ncbi:hypothetical protein [Variovorax sp. LT1R16]|uniref:hypothetical protein n=1 Tax=Variovorax sp. LT1R16 TaxID=3443728 RepID=UPI003F458A71
MLSIDVRNNFPEVKRLLGEQQRQIPFALALALTRTAQDVKKAEEAEMRSVFHMPTPYTLRSLYVKTATKQTLTAHVWVKDSERPTHYLLPQINGGNRPLKRFEQLLVQRGVLLPSERTVPGDGAKLDSYGNMGKGQIVKILSQLQAFNVAGSTANASSSRRSKAKRARETFFVSTGTGKHPFGGHSWKKGRKAQHLPRGIWVRYSFGAWGTAIKPVLLFVSRGTYRARFHFNDVAEATVTRVFPGHLQESVIRALATAKPARGAS